MLLTSPPPTSRKPSSPEAVAGPGLAVQRADRTGGLAPRLRAAVTHLLASLAVAACVMAVVYLGWYPAPLDAISGVGDVLLLLLAVDVALGPVLTAIVFDRRKKSLPFDLACIAVLQVGALAYGVHAVEAGRPHYLVFVKDRFEVVSHADLRKEDRLAAASNRAADADWFSPRIVAAQMPTDEQEKKDLLFESLQGGRDVQHFPKRYRDYATQAAPAAGKALPLQVLRDLNPDRIARLQAAVERSAVPESQLRFLPIKGPKGDAVMLIRAGSGAIVSMIDLVPWR